MAADRLDLSFSNGLGIDQGSDWGMDLVVHDDGQVLTVLNTPGAGSFRLGFLGSVNNNFTAGFQTQTDPIAYNATAATILAALQTLTNIGAGGVASVTGPAGGPWEVVLSDEVISNSGNPLFVVDASGLEPYGGAVSVERRILDLTGYEAAMQIRVGEEGSTPLVDLTSTPAAGITIDGPNGKISVTIDHTQTMSLPKGSENVYDLELTDTGGNIEALIYGAVEVRRNITR